VKVGDGLTIDIAIGRAGKSPGPVEVHRFHPIPERVLAGHWGKEEEGEFMCARIVSGEIPRERALAAAACGDRASALALGIPFEERAAMEPVAEALAPLGGEACARALLALYWNRDADLLCISQDATVPAGARTKEGQAVRALGKWLAHPGTTSLTDVYKAIDAVADDGHEELDRVIDVRGLATTEERLQFMAEALANYADNQEEDQTVNAYQQLSHTIGPWLLDGIDPYK